MKERILMSRLFVACVFAICAPHVRVVAQHTTPNPETILAYGNYALTHGGNVAKGKQLFADTKRTRCASCHVVNSQGGKAGPDLSSIGGKFDRSHLIESLLEPSRQIVEGYRTSVVLTTEGQLLTGTIKREKNTVVVMDAQGKAHSIAKNDIDTIKTSDVSMMPSDLATSLSKDEFTDLIAYLESLRTGSKNKMGAGVRGPIQVPDGYQIETIATGLSGATALEVMDDGRVLICEQHGELRVVKDGKLLEDPMLILNVEHYWERGLIGVTIDPNFQSEPWVYVCYVAGEPYPHHRVSRFRVERDSASRDSEQLLLKGDDQSTLGGKVPAGHQGGALHFGPDGKLYIGIGEQTAETPAQELDTFQGKILRINRDGSIPKDNPLLSKTSGKYQAIWAYGCRNPFTFAFEKNGDRMLINDVGGKFEEINPGEPGANFGWPTVEHGFTRQEGFVGPIYVYPQSSINGGDFAPETSPFGGRYFFADFVQGWIKMLDTKDPTKAAVFASGLRRPVDLRFASNGSLYVLLRNAWVVDRKFEGHTGSVLRIHR